MNADEKAPKCGYGIYWLNEWIVNVMVRKLRQNDSYSTQSVEKIFFIIKEKEEELSKFHLMHLLIYKIFKAI